MSSSDGPPCWGPCETQGKLFLMVFDDEADHWSSVKNQWDALECEELLHRASWSIPLTPLTNVFNRSVAIRESLRPRFWYFAFAACGVPMEEPVSYEIHAVNVRQGFEAEFGFDQRGAVPLQLFATAGFLAVLVVFRKLVGRATSAEVVRAKPLLRLLLLSASSSAGGAVLLLLHNLLYVWNGYGVFLFEILGQALCCLGRAFLTLLVVLTAKGWALFYAPEELGRRRIMVGILGFILLVSIGLEIRQDFFDDWSTTLFLYESNAGVVILVLNMVLALEAWRSLRETYSDDSSPALQEFYLSISAANVLYFGTLPCMSLLAMLLSPWLRAKYVDRAEVISRLAATILMTMCLRPSKLDAIVDAKTQEGVDTVDWTEDEEYSPCLADSKRQEALGLLASAERAERRSGDDE
eukprot:TRINITY_DN37022_c0_g1_i2.p1 TRINITY_DN37022_c0_g1~~TRINITY_DN37022_c0_g1_i2.p1  ORF type:complete len:410 (+),score=103.63 TRINITY_DN37022_c0_g1_i2:307-1536(+)